MASWLPSPLAGVPRPSLTDVIDILIVAVLIYQFLLIIRGRRAAHVMVGLCVLAAIYISAIWVKLEVLRTILATLAPYTAIALIVMYAVKALGVLRISEEVELQGLDIHEHGAPAYHPEFAYMGYSPIPGGRTNRLPTGGGVPVAGD